MVCPPHPTSLGATRHRWADLKDEREDGEGSWEGHWFALNSAGELRVFPDAESTEEQLVVTVDLKSIERVERSKGMDYYDFCIDLIGADTTTRMRPIDRGDMQAWLGVLQTQLSAFTTRTNKGSVVTTLQQGYLEKKGEKSKMGMGGDWKKRFFVLSARQEQAGEELEIHHYLNYFKSEDQAADIAEGGVIDLGDVDEVRKADNKGIEIVTENRLWQLRADAANTQEIWFNQLIRICSGDGNGNSAGGGSGGSAPVEKAKDAASMAKADMKMQVPGPDGQPTWKSASFELWSDGVLRWTSEEKWPWDAGAIDVSKAVGVWLLGPPGWRRLDIILPEHRWTLAAEGANGDETLQEWIKLLEGLAPEKPVSEIRNGWMEKKGAVGGGWKMRFFVLLSTHELLYFESDRSPKCKGVIDLKEASSCKRVASPDYNYEFAFEVIAPKRTWILCPDDETSMQEWMNDIQPLIKAGGKGATAKKKRNSVSSNGARSYEVDDGGSAAGDMRSSTSGAGGTMLKQGWLDKRGELNTAWKARYFVLTAADPYRDVPKMLRYYKDEETARIGKSGGAIECTDAVTAVKGISDDPSKLYSMEVTMPARTYALAAKTAADIDEWVSMIMSNDEGGAGAVDVTDGRGSVSQRDASASMVSMNSFTSSGPLNEVFSGWMKKKGQGVFGSKMQRRYFVLYDNQELHYFEGSSMENIQRKGKIALKEATAVQRLKPYDTKDYTFVIKAQGRDWVLDPGSHSVWEDWEQKLTPMVGGE